MASRRPRSSEASPLFLPPQVAAALGGEGDALLAALASEVPVSIRNNPAKPGHPQGDPVPWCASGRYLDERPSFTLDPLLHAGAYYVQEASSMLLERAFLRTGLGDAPIVAADLCAAPGGKSTHLSALLAPGSLLVCNEVVPARRYGLMENLWKHGSPGTMITGSPTADLLKLPGTFDLLLVDAPCSGEGMFRKDPFARSQWSERLVRTCARTQQDILDHAWEALKPGGWLIYSTCTWETAENEDQVRWLVERGGACVPIDVDPAWGMVATDLGLRCYPHRVRGEGFFVAVVRKPGERSATASSATVGGSPDEVARWVREPQEQAFVEQEDVLYAVPRDHAGLVADLCRTMKVVAPGIPVAERKGGGWRPHAALALSGLLAAEAFTAVDLDRDQALTYLRGETAVPVGSNGNGWPGVRLMRHAGLPLGWMHAAGDRWNNGWPKPWRIRMR